MIGFFDNINKPQRRSFMSQSYPDFWYRYRSRFARALGIDLTHSQRRYAALLEREVPHGSAWLDLGCGRQLLPEWACSLERQAALARRARILIGVDLDPSLLEHALIENRIFADVEQLPFRTESLDVVTANVVVEHVRDPRAMLNEIQRVLVPGGKFIFHTPNSLFYLVIIARLIPHRIRTKLTRLIEGRAEEDIFSGALSSEFNAQNPPSGGRMRASRCASGSCRFVRHFRQMGASGLAGIDRDPAHRIGSFQFQHPVRASEARSAVRNGWGSPAGLT
ncbi:MAG: class I SAM-dependent methyltransferase, partial [Bryobacteraceae bacterium]